MEQYISLFVVTLQKLGHLTEDEAKKLVKEYQTSTLPSDFKAMGLMVDKIFEDLKIKVDGRK